MVGINSNLIWCVLYFSVKLLKSCGDDYGKSERACRALVLITCGHDIGLVPCKWDMPDCTSVCMAEQIIFGQ